MLSPAVLVLALTSRATPATPATATTHAPAPTPATADPLASPEDYFLHLDEDVEKLFPPSHPTAADPLAMQMQDEQIYKELVEYLRPGVEEYLDRAVERAEERRAGRRAWDDQLQVMDYRAGGALLEVAPPSNGATTVASRQLRLTRLILARHTARKRKLRRPMDSPSAVSYGPPPHASTRPPVSPLVFSADAAAALPPVQPTPRKRLHSPVQNERHIWSPRPESQLRPMMRASPMIPYPRLRPPPKIRIPPRNHPPQTIHFPPATQPPQTIHPPPINRPLSTIYLPPTVFPPPVSWPAPATSHPQLVEVTKQKKLQRFMEFIKKNRNLLIQFIAAQERLYTSEGPALGPDPPLVRQGPHARPEETPANNIQVDANGKELDFANAGIFGSVSPAGMESVVEDTVGSDATEREVIGAGVMHGVAEVAPAAAMTGETGRTTGGIVANGRPVEADWSVQATALAAWVTRSLKRAMIADNKPRHQLLPDGVTRFHHPGERLMTAHPRAPVTPVMRVRARPSVVKNWLVLAGPSTTRRPLRAWGRPSETTLLKGLDGRDLDLLPAKGADIYRLRAKERVCQRHILRPEGPKYHRDGREYRHARPFRATAPPRFLIPICCNCCRKSVLGCS